MAKAVYRPLELDVNKDRIVLDPPTAFSELAHLMPVADEADEEEEQEKYTGPTVEDLKREADAFKRRWEAEKEGMIQFAKDEADRIVKEAEDTAFQEVKRKTDEAQILVRQAQEEADRIIAEGTEKARQIEAEISASADTQRKDAEEQGRIAGREEGFSEGKAEVERLVERARTVLERVQDKRGDIIAETEQEIVDLVLLITRKVVKIVIADNQRDVIVSNVIQALRKIKTRGNIFIRVNLADLKLTTEHLNNFIKLMEGAKSVQVVEDSSVDPGGCIIETDFGEIDARISSQLAEMEAKILKISPLTSRAKAVAKPGEA